MLNIISRQATLISGMLQLSFLKSEIDRLLTWSAIFSVSMVVVRIWYTNEYTFVFMPWNLFLAVVPYCLLQLFGHRVLSRSKTGAFALVFITWLLFVPNTFYMITDLFHLYQRDTVPKWFDLVLLMSFAWNGLILGTLSIRKMEKLLAIRFPGLPGNLFVASMMLLNAFGVYLGRYLRFNSWDVVANPFDLFLQILDLVFQPTDYKGAWAMILSFAVMMTIMYQMLKKLSRRLGG
ncbi:MAG: DUF1361 domain-containing protein [Pedobacter sp.]|nr:MAG: DUF1361 domain-containing protein [Pedobacter sp.]